MRSGHARSSRARRALTALSILLAVPAVGSPIASAETVVVDGAGSTWSQIAVDQWRADVARQGLTINYQGVGSSAGRAAYYQSQVDFAVSEIPFSDGTDGGVNEIALAAGRPYAYLPIVAGGTAFMYHLDVGGSRVTDLRLSPTTLAKIFTGAITNWNDPAIAADNNGRVLPSLPVKVVIRSDGSGTSAQFTAYMASQTPTEWNAFCSRAGLGSTCPATSLYPNPPGLNFASQQFSDGVANFVAAPYNNGSITYVEYGYAKERNYPVASIKNAAGSYAQPVAQSVSIALQGATLNSDGTQNLRGVYRHPDARAYPVSSYSYMIVPTTEVAPFSAGEGQALGNFILYFLCAGQQKAEQLGYSPLPKNLVEVGFAALAKIPGAPDAPAINTCSNPTITGDFMTGEGPVTTTPEPGGGGSTETTVPTDGGSSGGSGGGSGTDSGTGTDGGSTDGATGSIDIGTDPLGGSTGGETSDGSATGVDPLGGGSSQASGGGAAVATPMVLESTVSSPPTIVYVLALATLAGFLFGLPALVTRLRQRSGSA
ncbi:MAG: hypothetical protein RJB65_2459 [Actinomycetota bacterium]|jgi:phosphate transport system substrate-binding protein